MRARCPDCQAAESACQCPRCDSCGRPIGLCRCILEGASPDDIGTAFPDGTRVEVAWGPLARLGIVDGEPVDAHTFIVRIVLAGTKVTPTDETLRGAGLAARRWHKRLSARLPLEDLVDLVQPRYPYNSNLGATRRDRLRTINGIISIQIQLFALALPIMRQHIRSLDMAGRVDTEDCSPKEREPISECVAESLRELTSWDSEKWRRQKQEVFQMLKTYERSAEVAGATLDAALGRLERGEELWPSAEFPDGGPVTFARLSEHEKEARRKAGRR